LTPQLLSQLLPADRLFSSSWPTSQGLLIFSAIFPLHVPSFSFLTLRFVAISLPFPSSSSFPHPLPLESFTPLGLLPPRSRFERPPPNFDEKFPPLYGLSFVLFCGLSLRPPPLQHKRPCPVFSHFIPGFPSPPISREIPEWGGVPRAPGGDQGPARALRTTNLPTFQTPNTDDTNTPPQSTPANHERPHHKTYTPPPQPPSPTPPPQPTR